MVRKDSDPSEADGSPNELSRRTALQATGVVLGGTQLFSSAASATLQSKKAGIEVLDGTAKADAIDTVMESERVSRISDYLETERNLSVSPDIAEVYRVSTKGGKYTVVSLFPQYPNQSDRAMGTNVAVLLVDGSVAAINALASEYEGRRPKWVYNFVLDGNSVEKIATKISSSENGTLSLNSETMKDVRPVAKNIVARFDALDVNPGMAALPLLVEIDPALDQKTLAVASTVSTYSAHASGSGLQV